MSDQIDNGNFSIIKKTHTTYEKIIISSVWQMKRKSNTMARATTQYKACLNIDGSCMRQGIYYDNNMYQW